MSQKNRATVRIQFGDGSHLDQFTSFSLTDSFVDPLGNYQLTTMPIPKDRADYRRKLRKGELVTVKLNAITLGTYLIVTVKRTYPKSGVVFAVTMKSVLVTPYEASCDTGPGTKLSLKSQTDTSVSDLILKAMSPFGFDTLVGDAAANRNALTGASIGGKAPPITVPHLKLKEMEPQEGEKVYGYCSRIFNRFGVALRVNAIGELLLETPDYDQQAIATLVSDHGGNVPGDRLLEGWSIEETNEGQYSECYVRGNADPTNDTQTSLPRARVLAATLLPADATAAEVAKLQKEVNRRSAKVASNKVTPVNYTPPRPTYTSTAACYKPLNILDKHAVSADRCQSVAKLALGIRAKDANVITGSVDGFIASTGIVWGINTVVHVNIPEEGIAESWWVLSRTFTESMDGQRTQLTLLPLGSLILGDVPN